MNRREESNEKRKRRLEQLIEIINELIRFLEPFKPFLNSHNVQFLVENHWQDEVLIRKETRENLDEFVSNEMMKTSNDSAETKVNLIKYWLEFSRKNIAPMNCLEELFSKLNQLKTVWDEQVVCTNHLFETESADYERQLEEKFNRMRKQNRFMNEKKSYEVDLMSKFVARLCNKLDIQTVTKTNMFDFKLCFYKYSLRLFLFRILDCGHWKWQSVLECSTQLARI